MNDKILVLVIFSFPALCDTYNTFGNSSDTSTFDVDRELSATFDVA